MNALILAAILQAQGTPLGEFKVTGYCSCSRCCGRWADGKTATGKKVRWGYVATDWGVIPKKSKIRIEGFKTVFRVEDRGGAIKGKRIDIWFSSHQKARKFGVSKRRVWLQDNGRWKVVAAIAP